jgi:hypothetical protein
VYKISDLFEGDRIKYTDDIETVPVELIFCWYRNLNFILMLVALFHQIYVYISI